MLVLSAKCNKPLWSGARRAACGRSRSDGREPMAQHRHCAGRKWTGVPGAVAAILSDEARFEIRIQHELPFVDPLDRRDPERQLFMMCIQQHEKIVVSDRTATLVMFVDGFS